MLRRTLQTTRGRLGLLVVTVTFVMLTTSALLHWVFDQFDDYGEALWSAAVHLVDPGALVEDEDASERAMGMFQAVAGLVLLIGLLFELVSETVGRSIERLGRFDPPVRARDHLLIVGGGEMLAEAAGALAMAEDVGRPHERIVVVAPESERPSRGRMLEELAEQSGRSRLDLVFGEVGEESGFDLGAAGEAATILVLPSGSGPVAAESTDVEVMQVGLALEEYLNERGASPEVRLLFRRGRDVDAVQGMFPAGWDPIVGDRTVSGVLRRAITGMEGIPEIEALVGAHGAGDPALLTAARERCATEGRPMRLVVVGCGIDTPALLEDVAEAGATGFEVAILAPRLAFQTYLGRTDRAGVEVDYHEASGDDPELLASTLRRLDPDVVVVSPSPQSWDLRDSDAEATIAVLHVLRALGPDVPVLAELFLPEAAERLPGDRRLLPVSVLETVSGALALSVFNPERSRSLVRQLGVE